MKSIQEGTLAGERTLLHRMAGILDSHKRAGTPNVSNAAERLAPQVDSWAARYKSLRETSKTLHGIAVKRLSKSAINDFAQRLGILRNGVLVFDSEHDAEVLFDFAIYNQQQNGLTVFEDMARDASLSLNSDERLLLTATLNSYHTLIMITDVIPGFGVEVVDILQNEQFLLADVNFSRTATPGVSLATRVKPVGDFWMSSGASLSVMDEQVLLKIDEYLKKFFPKIRDFRQLDPRRKAELQGFIIRSCLKSQASQHLMTADPDSEEAARILREGRAIDEEGRRFKIGRNDPCPCGSGRKYKKCCGHGIR